jgi:small subunit ribosomal protein S17
MADEEKTDETTETAAEAETPVADEAETPAVDDGDQVADSPPEETPEPEAEAPAEEAPAAEEPAAEAEAEAPAAAEPAAPEEPPAPAPQSQPKQKHKRLPRPLRPKKGRRQRTPATERKAISREEKPEHDRGRRQERRGVVVSDAMDKTIVVKVDSIRSHSKYKKVIRRSIKFHAHDEENSAHIGDVVRIVETRPLSKTKRWRLAEIVEVAK